MSADAHLREQLCLLGRSLFERGLTHGSTGNLSVRVEHEW
ncbi:MAG: aldolase, partial [Casimicrobiaceae bacterium]